MRPPDPEKHSVSPGFTLPAVLVVVAALLILAVGILAISGIERSTARAYVDRERAAMAAHAGLEEVRAILDQEAANDDYVILQSTIAKPPQSDPDTDAIATPYLFLARGFKGPSDTAPKFRYLPLFSNLMAPLDTAGLKPPDVSQCVTQDDKKIAKFRTLPWTYDEAKLEWIPVTDDKDRVVARYAYWVEDMQGRIDASTAGNLTAAGGSHTRTAYPFPAAGMRDPAATTAGDPLDQIALFSLDPTATEAAQGDLGKNLINRRKFMISPGSLPAVAGIAAPLERDGKNESSAAEYGRLKNKIARNLEECAAPSRGAAYMEQPLVPWADGISSAMSGKPKMNLNDMLDLTDRSTALDNMNTQITNALPLFDARKGGFADDYVRTLAANALDYADKDSDATLVANSGSIRPMVRGLDAYPLMNEHTLQFSWNGGITKNGRKYALFSATVFVELWNMTNQPVAGTMEVTYENNFKASIDSNPNVNFGNMEYAVDPMLGAKDGYYWFPGLSVQLEPNQLKMFKCGVVNFEVEYTSDKMASPLTIPPDPSVTNSGFHMKWNGKVVDWASGGFFRRDKSLNRSQQSKSDTYQDTNNYPAALIYGGSGYYRRMGDPRMSCYLTRQVGMSDYSQNFSPSRRNVRITIYKGDTSKLNARVLPSEWPDGGHDSDFAFNGYIAKDERVLADDARFDPYGATVPVDGTAAPMFISNRGRFFSATELGNAYDPIQHDTGSPDMNAGERYVFTNPQNKPWKDVETVYPDPGSGGGNTLRIGRPEHPAFTGTTSTGKEAWQLLNLFHAGDRTVPGETGGREKTVKIDGHVNLNTAGREAIRALVYGALKMDPVMERKTGPMPDPALGDKTFRFPTSPYVMPEDEMRAESARIADAIIKRRSSNPFASLPEIMEATWPVTDPYTGTQAQESVIGNKRAIKDGKDILRSDKAAEELFARLYEAGTVRSRNFRVWVVGQAVAPFAKTSPPTSAEVLGEVRKAFTVFHDPGKRTADGALEPKTSKLSISHETDF